MSELSDQAIDDAVASGDLDAINKLLDAYEEVGAEEKEVEDPKEELALSDVPAEEESPDQAESKAEEDTKPKTEDGDSEATSAPEGILTKDGKHVMPYARFEQKQKQVAERDQEISSLKTQMEDLKKASEENSGLLNKLKESGVDPENINDPSNLTEEQLEALDEFDDLGQTVKAVYQKADAQSKRVEALESQIAKLLKQNEPKDEGMAAIESDPNLGEWINDPDIWPIAQAHDTTLQALPQYKDLSLKQRIPEIVKRVQADLGITPFDNAKAEPKVDPEKLAGQIAQKQLQDKQQIPSSLTESGTSPSVEKSFVEQIAELSGQAQIDALEKLTPAMRAQVFEAI